MGAIFAIKHNGVVYMAADAVKGDGATKEYVNERSNLKIRMLPLGILCGSIGKSCVAQRLYLHDEWFELEEGERFDKRFLVEKIVPRFQKELDELELWQEMREGSHVAEVNANFILARGSDVYVMFNDLSVVKCGGIAVFSDDNGTDELMRVYAEACGERDPLALIRKTFDFASRVRRGISMHGYVINTTELEFSRMEDLA